jgi:hypothetical protein
MDSKIFPSTLNNNNNSSANMSKGGSASTLVSQSSGLDKLKKLADSLDPMEIDDRNKNPLELFRLRMKDFFHHHFIGGVYQMILLFLSVISVFQYIYGTYVDNYSSHRMNMMESIMAKIELVFAGIFGFDWCLNLFLADNRISYLTSFFSMIDLLTVIPTFAVYQQQCPRFHRNMTGEEIIYYILCGMVTTRILRALRVRSRFLFIEDEVQRALANMGLNIAVMILYNSALMQYFEPDQQLDFHTWMYYIFVTVATVGYGDITPQTILGRFAAMGMIGIAIITVPDMTNDLLAKMASQSFYARARYNAKTGRSQHVLICGDVKSSSMIEFFKELFHEDHEMENLHAVVLQPGLPTHEMQLILKDPAFQLSVTYLEGSPLSDKDLNRANAEKARAVFLMTNKFSAHPDNEDAKIILQQFSIQRYLRIYSPNQLKRTLFCMQLIRPENKRHLVTATTNAHNRDSTNESHENTNLVVCLNEIKMGVIAKAVIFPGTNTLIMNLLFSFSDDTNTGASNMNAKHIEGIETLEEDEDSSDWIGEYQRGCDWEIYTTALSPSFEGATFCSLSEILYSKMGIVLFGLEVEDLRKDKSPARIVVNPADFVIPSQEEARITAFVIAKNKAQSDLSFSYENDDMHLSHLSMLSGALAANTPSHMSSHHGPQRLSIAHRPALFGALGPITFQSKSVGSGTDDEAKERSAKAAKKEKLAWQALLRRHESEKSAETMQEELQKAEDQHLRENYYVKDYLMDMRDAVVKTSVTDAKPFIENHIIIIGKALSNLYDLIRPLRAKTLGTLKHIVILYPDEFPIAVWQRISVFESVWIVRGSPLEESDIRRCGIFKCKQVVMLADASMLSSTMLDKGQNAADIDALVDADAIFCYQAVKRLNETANIVVEVVRQSNVSYLDPETGLNSTDIDYKFTPQFASGALFTTSLLDTLACQAFYNTKIVEVINKFVGFGVEYKDKLERHGGGSISAPNSPARNKYPEANNGDSPIRTPFNPKTLVGSALYQIPVLVEGLESRTYGALYSHLAKRKQIPLGILRGVFNNTKSGPKANKMPYVFTNPPKDTELFSCDKVFVLSQTPVKLRGTKEEPKENSTVAFQMRERQKTADDIVNIIADLTEQINRQKEEQDALLATQVGQLQEQMQYQMQHVMNIVEQTAMLASQAAHASHYIAHQMANNGSVGNGNNNNNGNNSSNPPSGNRPASVSFAQDGKSPSNSNSSNGGTTPSASGRRPSLFARNPPPQTQPPATYDFANGYYTLPVLDFGNPNVTPIRQSILRPPGALGANRPVSANGGLYSSPSNQNRSGTPTALPRSGGGGSGAGLAPYKSPSNSRRNSTSPMVPLPVPSGNGTRSLNSTPIHSQSTNQTPSNSANRKRVHSSHY